MSELRVIQIVATGLLSCIAWAFWTRQRSHAAFAAFATWMAAMDLVRIGLAAKRVGLAHPLHGAARAAFHAEQAIVLSWSLLFLACCLHYFVKRATWIPIAMWAVVSVALVVAYPNGAKSFAQLYTTRVFYVVTFLSWAVMLYGAASRRVRLELAHVMLMLYAAVDAVVIAVPLARADMANWPVVRAASTLGAAAMIAAHGVVMLRGTGSAQRVATEVA
jgi:hypothetical protein